MKKAFNTSNILFTRLCNLHSLVFFMLVLSSCTHKKNEISVFWDDDKAKSVSIPSNLVADVPKDSIGKFLEVRLVDSHDSGAMLGEYKPGEEIVFQPVVPFSRGMSYEIFSKNKKIGQFKIASADIKDAPQLVSVYPVQDTVPENLLKIYIEFSRPMREGQSAKYITVIKNGTTLTNVFLDLQPELWNEDRTVLTAWLDPGRIKRGLQPNLKLGAPLQQKEKYSLVISKEWKDIRGLPLQEDFIKTFITDGRDALSPDPGRWKINSPKANSKDALTIDISEPLDHFLLKECISVTGTDGRELKGRLMVEKGDKTCHFIPELPWPRGNYSLVVETRLEDLAGNNLNRLFDRDITQSKTPGTKDIYKKQFNVE